MCSPDQKWQILVKCTWVFSCSTVSKKSPRGFSNKTVACLPTAPSLGAVFFNSRLTKSQNGLALGCAFPVPR